MNKFIIGGATAIVMAIGVIAIVTSKDSDSPSSNNPIVTSASTQEDGTQLNENHTSDRYIEYSEANLQSTAGTKQVVFFHAPWCSTCNAFEKEILAIGVPEGITILKADYDNDTALKQKYSVRLQSTFVLLNENGEGIQSWPFGQGLSNTITSLYEQII